MDIFALFLADKRSAGTRSGYRRDLIDFFGSCLLSGDPNVVEAFLRQPRLHIASALQGYKVRLIAKGLSEATVNRRLAAVKSLLRFAHRMEVCVTDGRGLVESERVVGYRDTRGISVAQMRQLLKLPDTSTTRGLRDGAMLRLLTENALRRAEVCSLDVADLRLDGSLDVLGKGKGTQKVEVRLSEAALGAIAEYLWAAGHKDGALFRSASGRRLSTRGLYVIVRGYGAKMGIHLRPHMLRHACLTAALEATNGDIRRVQQLSRHANVNTLLIYDDHRRQHQAGVTDLLSKMLE